MLGKNVENPSGLNNISESHNSILEARKRRVMNMSQVPNIVVRNEDLGHDFGLRKSSERRHYMPRDHTEILKFRDPD